MISARLSTPDPTCLSASSKAEGAGPAPRFHSSPPLLEACYLKFATVKYEISHFGTYKPEHHYALAWAGPFANHAFFCFEHAQENVQARRPSLPHPFFRSPKNSVSGGFMGHVASNALQFHSDFWLILRTAPVDGDTSFENRGFLQACKL